MEDLLDLLEHYGYPELVKELEACAAAMEANVLKFNLSNTNAQTELLITKARAEGARQTVDTFKRRMETLRPTKSKVRRKYE